MPRINILFVITKLELGGAQKQLLSLIQHLDKQRFAPFLFTAKDGFLLPEAASIAGVTLIRSKSLERPINPARDLLALIEIYRAIKKNKITLVHTHSSKAGILGRIAARLAKVKFIIHTVHGWPFHCGQTKLARALFVQLERYVGRFTDKIIVVCRADKEKGLKERIGGENRFTLINYGIDHREFCGYRRYFSQELGIARGDIVVTDISCFKPQKSPLDFVRLAALIAPVFPPAKFLLVGDGILRGRIEDLIARLNLKKRVILAGWRWDIPEILAASDVLVLTSLWEGLPVVVLEALASGCPVIATATGGVAEVIQEGKNGFLVPARDTLTMSEKLLALLKDETLRKTMGRNARNLLGADFSLEKMVANQQNLYTGFLNNKRGALCARN